MDNNMIRNMLPHASISAAEKYAVGRITTLKEINNKLCSIIRSQCRHDEDCKLGGGAIVRYGQDSCTCGLTETLKMADNA